MNPGQPPSSRGVRLRLVFGVAAGVVVLAMLGFVIGWALRGSSPATALPAASATPSSPPVTSPSSEPASGLASPAPTVTLITLGPLALPDLAGQDFVSSRQRLRDLQLGVQVFFEPDASTALGTPAGVVERTIPAAGTPVEPGITVKLYVSGARPLLTPPNVVGRACNEAGKAIAEAGLYPQYPSGRQGTVTSQTPAATDPGVRWNDQVQLVCQA